MTQGLTGWETKRLSKHFILLDFMADRAVYRSGEPLPFNETWKNGEHDALAEGLCGQLLEPIVDNFGPISVADAFWPASIAEKSWPRKLQMDHKGSKVGKHRWERGEATVDIALYKMVDEGWRGRGLKMAVESIEAVDSYRDRVMGYPTTEFVCVTFKREGARKCGQYLPTKAQNLRAHHVRVGRYFNLLDFCRSGRAVEEGVDLVPKGAECRKRTYRPIPEEMAARSFAAALDPFVEKVGRISVVRGIETDRFADDEHAEMHRWNRDGPWRLVFVLPQETDPEEACDLLKRCPHVRDVQPSRHPSDSWSLALVVDRKEYEEYRGLRPIYPGGH